MFWQLDIFCSLFLLFARLLRTCCWWLHLHSVHGITVHLRGLNSFHWLHHSIHLYRSDTSCSPRLTMQTCMGPFPSISTGTANTDTESLGSNINGASVGFSSVALTNFIVFGGTEVFLCNNTRLTFISWPSPFCFMVACTRSPFPISRMLPSKSILHCTDLRKSMPMMKSSPMSASTTSQKYFHPPNWKPKCCTMPPSIHESICALCSCTLSTGSSHPNSWLSLRLISVTCAAVSTTAMIFRCPIHTGTIMVSDWFGAQLNCRTWGCGVSTWAPAASLTEAGPRHRSVSGADVATVASPPSSLTASVDTTIRCCSWTSTAAPLCDSLPAHQLLHHGRFLLAA